MCIINNNIQLIIVFNVNCHLLFLVDIDCDKQSFQPNYGRC